MKPQTTSQIINTIKVITLALLLALGISYVSAQWSGPTAGPPNNNVSAPINVGSADQTKTGKLGVGSLVVGVGGSIISPNTLSSYGSTTIQGSKNGWSGINFRDSAGANSGTLMMNPTYSGFYNGADSAWRWYVDNAGNTIQPGAASIAGTATVGGLKIATGAGAGKVLTSSADGTGTWQAAAAGPAGPTGPIGPTGPAGGGGSGGTVTNRPIGTIIPISISLQYSDYIGSLTLFQQFTSNTAFVLATNSPSYNQEGLNVTLILATALNTSWQKKLVGTWELTNLIRDDFGTLTGTVKRIL